MYRQFFYDTLSAAKRRRYHLSFAQRLLSGYQGNLSDLAAQLAYHFEAGGDIPKAIEFRNLATEQAADLSTALSDETLLIHTKGRLAHLRSMIEGYQAEYAADYEAAFELSNTLNDTALKRVHYPSHLYYLIIRSNYLKANLLADMTKQLAIDNGDAVSYPSCEFFHAWALFHEGRWGEMQTVITESLHLAQKNEYTPWILHFQLLQAWLLLHVFDYDGLYFFSLIILIHLRVKAPEQVHGQDYVSDVLAHIESNPLSIDWVLRFSLQQALAEHYLSKAKWPEARQAADTYLANACERLSATDLPVIAWRVYDLQDNQRYAAAEIQRLLKKMESTPALHQRFKDSEEIKHIYGSSKPQASY